MNMVNVIHTYTHMHINVYTLNNYTHAPANEVNMIMTAHVADATCRNFK